MGALADFMIAYAQPLLDQTDGSHEEMEKALSISSLCFNLAQVPAAHRAEAFSKMQASTEISDEEFEEFRSSIVHPMIERYEAMFSKAAQNSRDSVSNYFAHSIAPPVERLRRAQPLTIDPPVKKTEPLPYAACPCNSGKKYKFCCKQTKSFAGVS